MKPLNLAIRKMRKDKTQVKVIKIPSNELNLNRERKLNYLKMLC